jgi:putative DNA primase/helicase
VLDYLTKSKRPKTSAKREGVKPKPKQQIPPIPIARCLSKQHQSALQTGEREGNRDNMAASLARDLIGVFQHVPEIEFKYRGKIYRLDVDGDPQGLLVEYLSRCSPPLTEQDGDRIYRSALKDNPTPSIQDEEKLVNCLKSWVKEHLDRSGGNADSHPQNHPPHFVSSIDRGLVRITYKTDEDGAKQESRESIGNHLQAIAYVDNPDRDGASILLEFKSLRGEVRRWTMARADLAVDTNAILGGLLSRGYTFHRKQKTLLLEYLQGLGTDIDRVYTITDTSGWVDRSFVMPHKTYGDPNLRFRDVDPSPEVMTKIVGTLSGWKNGVAARCADNSRAIFALGVSFAAPLLPVIDLESGGFHFVGATSIGKTTLLSIAASVTGVKDLPHWRTTTNGLESTATAFNHQCLPLDEIGQADPRDVGNIAYMLANGQGKARMKRDLSNRKGKTWRLMVLSSGEIGLGNYMKQANLTQKGGQEVRLPDIPAMPKNSKYGVFETIHEAENPVQFVSALDAAIAEHRGVAMDEFLSRLVKDAAEPSFAGTISKQVYLIAAKLTQGTRDTAIARVAKRFALVQVALVVRQRNFA